MQNPRSRFPPAAVVAAVILLTTLPVQCAEAGDFSRQTTKQRTDDGRAHEDACCELASGRYAADGKAKFSREWRFGARSHVNHTPCSARR
jgi:hypothetical protein